VILVTIDLDRIASWEKELDRVLETFQGAFLELHLNFCLNDRLKFEAIVEMAIGVKKLTAELNNDSNILR
jgi:hypothetical protein